MLGKVILAGDRFLSAVHPHLAEMGFVAQQDAPPQPAQPEIQPVSPAVVANVIDLASRRPEPQVQTAEPDVNTEAEVLDINEQLRLEAIAQAQQAVDEAHNPSSQEGGLDVSQAA
jgi:hypothetical protein